MCGHIVWKNMGGQRTDSHTGRNYKIAGEYQGKLQKCPSRDVQEVQCDHDYQKERIIGAHTGDWKCTKCGHVTQSRPN